METKRLSFPKKTEFARELQSRVNDYFAQKQIDKVGNSTLYTKAILSFLLYIGSYIALVFYAQTWMSGVLFAFLFANGMILVAFNVMHDGAHGSFSNKKWLNWCAGASMDLLGSSQSLWKQKHNALHHTYTNINGKDDDIELAGLMRFSPTQKWQPWHRFQHLYAPFLYALLTLFMAFFSDFQKIISNRICDVPLQKRKAWELPYFIGAKIFYFAYTLFIPMMFHSPSVVILFFIGIHLFFGFILALVFQLAHTVNMTDFPEENSDNELPMEWFEHQLSTTANFAMENRFVRFYTGGLNQQIEHHLFNKTSHVHYYPLSKIVQQTCQEYGMPYHVNPSFMAATASHFQFLKRLGQKPA